MFSVERRVVVVEGGWGVTTDIIPYAARRPSALVDKRISHHAERSQGKIRWDDGCPARRHRPPDFMEDLIDS